jgi:hypothetical protein
MRTDNARGTHALEAAADNLLCLVDERDELAPPRDHADVRLDRRSIRPAGQRSTPRSRRSISCAAAIGLELLRLEGGLEGDWG